MDAPHGEREDGQLGKEPPSARKEMIVTPGGRTVALYTINGDAEDKELVMLVHG